MKPKRIQRKRTKGYNMQEYSRAVNGLEAVSVTRPGRWGNPFRVERCDLEYLVTRRGMVLSFHANKKAAVRASIDMFEHYVYLSAFDPSDKELLRGKNLACFCKEGEPCHGDVLLKWANS